MTTKKFHIHLLMLKGLLFVAMLYSFDLLTDYIYVKNRVVKIAVN